MKKRVLIALFIMGGVVVPAFANPYVPASEISNVGGPLKSCVMIASILMLEVLVLLLLLREYRLRWARLAVVLFAVNCVSFAFAFTNPVALYVTNQRLSGADFIVFEAIVIAIETVALMRIAGMRFVRTESSISMSWSGAVRPVILGNALSVVLGIVVVLVLR